MECYGDPLHHLPLRPPGSHTPLGVGSHLRTSLHGAGLIPSAVVEGVGASAQSSQPPSRSGWLVEAVILPGSTGRSPGKTAVLSATRGNPWWGQAATASSAPASCVSRAGLTPHQGPERAALGLDHTNPLSFSLEAQERVTWSLN